jgi:hypothetical protein
MKNPATRNQKQNSVRHARQQQTGYANVHHHIVQLLHTVRQNTARAINAFITASYWEIGRHIVELEQRGANRAAYGELLIQRLASDLTSQFERGFSKRNLEQMRQFYMNWPIAQTVSAQSSRVARTDAFPLPWPAYARLLAVKNQHARTFYETGALRAGWSVRQLDRQINSQFYERTALSRNKAALLRKAEVALPEDVITAEQAIKDPYVLKFLNQKDEYSETDMEDALINKLQNISKNPSCPRRRASSASFLPDSRLRGNLMLCAQKDNAVAHYALEGLPNKVLAAEYKTVLPDAKSIANAINEGRRGLAMQMKKSGATIQRIHKPVRKAK